MVIFHLKMYAYKVPPKRPSDAIQVGDTYWKKQEGPYAWNGNFWNVWFKEVPKVGDIVLGHRIVNIYRYRNLKKAIVKLESI